MKIDKNEIATKLKKLKGILNKKVEGTALNGILFKDNYLYATNTDIGIKATLDIENSGEAFIIPRPAIELIENLPNGIVEITSDNNSISIKSGTIKNKYSTYATDSFPDIKSISNEGNAATMKSGEFLDALNSTLYAVSENAIKEVLKGILLDAHEGNLNIVGCDGYRIAWCKISYNENFKVIIPKSTIKQLLSIGISGDISFAWDEQRILFKSEEYEIHSRLLTGEFVSYENMFVDYPNQTIVDRKTFIECLRRAMICCDDKSKNALKCRFSDDNLFVTLNKDNSEYEEIVKLEVPTNEPLSIGFNIRYLLDAMSAFMSDKVSIRLGNEKQAMIIDDGDLYSCVLPVRL